MGMFGGDRGLFGLLVMAVVLVIPAWRVVQKAGFPGAWALLLLVPLVNVAALWLFAFTRWPNERRRLDGSDG